LNAEGGGKHDPDRESRCERRSARHGSPRAR
jgi:hypothetical protein